MIMVKPTIGNTLLWRSVYLSEGEFYIDVVRAGLTSRFYQGTSIDKFKLKDSLPDLDEGSVLYHDIQRFEKFSDGFVSQHPERDEVLGDVRYSMNPIGDKPLWGIEMNLADTTQHIKFGSYRTSTKESKQQFIDMLLGKDIDNEL